ncbi:MAG: UDP-3-O-(3-hydroxymyristoyl)glucosamine N-acyltransferase [Chthoniobacteraceae bacterium]
MTVTLEKLAALTGGTLENGSPDLIISGAAAVHEAACDEVTFFGNARYLPALKQTQAAAAFVPLDFSERIGPALIKVANPSLAFAHALQIFAPPPVAYAPGIHPTAVIGPDVTLDESVSIQPYAVIERGAVIGAGSVIGAHVFLGRESTIGPQCHIHPNVTIRERTRIGARVIIHSGTVIGSDGFGYEFSEGRHVKIPQTGIVQIDDDVEIGANVAVDRARFGRTWIQEGTKIDNLVQIAHNVVIGKYSIIVSQTGISGSSKLGQYVTLAGQVGLVGHIEIGDRAIVGAKSGVSKNIPAGETWFGYPAAPMRESKERLAYINRLEKLYARVRILEQVLDEKGNSSKGET